jgi:transcriptional regulator with XRE-family HTH domain
MPKRAGLSQRMKQALDMLASTPAITQRDVAKRCGFSETHLSRILHTQAAEEFINRKARANLLAGRLRASKRLVELIDHDSGRVCFESSRHVLSLGGIAPPERPMPSVSISISPGYIVAFDSPPTIDAKAEAVPELEHRDVGPALDCLPDRMSPNRDRDLAPLPPRVPPKPPPEPSTPRTEFDKAFERSEREAMQRRR